MIIFILKAAHVGIGIYGKEGSQALSASDYAIGQVILFQCRIFKNFGEIFLLCLVPIFV